MFENLFDGGNLWVILVLEYISISYWATSQVQNSEHPGARFLMPPWLFSNAAKNLTVIGVISGLMVAVYIGLYDGFWAAIVGGLVINFLAPIIAKIFKFERWVIHHFVAATLLTPLAILIFFQYLPGDEDFDDYSLKSTSISAV